MSYYNGSSRKLYRSNDGVIFGVCGGIAEYFDLSRWGVRLVWVLMTIFGLPFSILAYFALGLILKRRPYEPVVSGSSADDWTHASSSEMLERLTRRFAALDERLQRMESVVTSPGYRIDRECR